MKTALSLLLFLLIFNPLQAQKDTSKINLLVITGGPTIRYHIDLVPSSFYGLFAGQEDLEWTHASMAEAALQTDRLHTFDVLLFYNRDDTLSHDSRKKLMEFAASGKGIVVLHHSLGNFNHWEWWWKELAGAKYQMKDEEGYPKSGYKQGESIGFIPQKDHYLAETLGEFSIIDEAYNKLWISEEVEVIYSTRNENSDGPLVWVSPYTQSRVLVIQPGHDATAHNDPNYQSLIHHSIRWVAGRTQD